MSKFKFGDSVMVSGMEARVVSITKDSLGYSCRVQFKDGAESVYPENHIRLLSRNYRKTKENNETHCPKCSTKWIITEHPFLGKKKMWFDCSVCVLTREEIEKS